MNHLRKAAPYLLVILLAALAYDAWIFGSRWYARRTQSRQAEQAIRAKEKADAENTIAMLGGGELKILSFYANPGAIRSGGHSTICYGVYGARAVYLEPPVERMYPAVQRCFSVSPAKSTEYTLVAEDRAGRAITQKLRVQVDK